MEKRRMTGHVVGYIFMFFALGALLVLGIAWLAGFFELFSGTPPSETVKADYFFIQVPAHEIDNRVAEFNQPGFLDDARFRRGAPCQLDVQGGDIVEYKGSGKYEIEFGTAGVQNQTVSSSCSSGTFRFEIQSAEIDFDGTITTGGITTIDPANPSGPKVDFNVTVAPPGYHRKISTGGIPHRVRFGMVGIKVDPNSGSPAPGDQIWMILTGEFFGG